MTRKREGGAINNLGIFVVLTDSTRVDEGWNHSCGEPIMSADVVLSHRNPQFTLAGDGSVERQPVPYCPKCEKKPLTGTFQYDGKWQIDRWEE